MAQEQPYTRAGALRDPPWTEKAMFQYEQAPTTVQ